MKKARLTNYRYLYKLCWVPLTLFLVACGTNQNNDPQSDIGIPIKPVANQLLKLHPASTCDDLKAYITESLIQQYASIPQYIEYYYCPAPVSGGGSAGDANLAPAPAPEAGSGSSTSDATVPDDVSDTNNQEAGVNEPDIIKADMSGNIYMVSGRHFIVARGFPPTEMNELARIDLGGRGLNLFLDRENQRVVVMARNDEPFYITDTAPPESSSVIYPPPEHDYTVALFYNVSTPSQPQLLRQLRLQGYYREGRGINDRIHLVSNHHLRPMNLFSNAEFNSAYQAFHNALYQARCNNPDVNVEEDPLVVDTQNQLVSIITSIVSATDPVDYLPKAHELVDGSPVEVPYLACTDINFPQVKMSLGLQVITSVNSDGNNLDATAIINNSYITYASENNIYLAETSRNWWIRLNDGSWPTSQTAIYKFAISGSAPQYLSTGRVDGYVNNQFSFSEYNGVLRVATTQDDVVETDDNLWQRMLSNNVFVLSDQASSGDLNVIGEVRNFAAGETIRSSRFYDSKGFVVTFRNVDPLFTFDLTDPENPSLEGELIIPGFSTYIHQYDENHLLTIGRAGGEGGVGVGNGLQLQLIDVSDLQDPAVVQSYVPDMGDSWSWSSAQYDHKAFTFYKPANLLAIPVQVYPWASADFFSGIIAYDVNLDTGFQEIGRVDHKGLSYEYYCGPNSGLLPEYETRCIDGMYMEWASPRRSVVMTGNNDVYLYTMSDVGLKASSISNLSSSLGQLIFPLQPYPWWYFGYYPVGVVDPLPITDGVAVGGSPVPVVF